jgi:hypothetical protein
VTQNDPKATVYHYECADIKLDAQQLGGSVPDFFQTDPECSIPLSHVLFDQLKDNNVNLPGSNQAMVHVQVRNRGVSVADNIVVWVLYARAGAGLPSLSSSAAQGNNFQFWKRFLVIGRITPSLPMDSPWKAVGSPQKLSGISPTNPQVVSGNWTVPTWPSGDPSQLLHGGICAVFSIF